MSFLSKLFKNVPRNHFKLPMEDFKAIHSYEADGETYEVFQHSETRVQLIVQVDTLKVVDIKAGRYKMQGIY
ncbi:hypothetical protein NX029_26235 [Cytobacillus firmus]|nr:hypothetical protein [Cytobacillus firmus]